MFNMYQCDSYNQLTIAMFEMRNRITIQSKNNVCKSDVKIGDCAHSLEIYQHHVGDRKPHMIYQARYDQPIEDLYLRAVSVTTLSNIKY